MAIIYLTDQPHNSMVNSGNIMSASILINKIKSEMEVPEKYDFFLLFFKKLAGGEFIGFNNHVFLSEHYLHRPLY